MVCVLSFVVCRSRAETDSDCCSGVVVVVVCVRDAEYIDKIGETRQQLYDLILAANYMDIKSLLHLGCAKVASLIKGQPLEKIKEILDPNQGAKKADSKDSKDSKSDSKAAAAGGAAAAVDTKKDNKK